MSEQDDPNVRLGNGIEKYPEIAAAFAWLAADPKVLISPEDAHVIFLSIFGTFEHLREC